MTSDFREFCTRSKPLIGVVHVRPLPGAPGYEGDLEAVHRHAVDQARALLDGGADAIIVENFGDAPFFPDRVPSWTVAALTAIASSIRQLSDRPLGVNVLRNDGLAALSIAQAAGAQFVRVNVLAGARLSDQGILQGIAHDLLRWRTYLGAHAIAILADIEVKHSVPLVTQPLREAVEELRERAGADALIVTGPTTGRAADPQRLRQTKEHAGSLPVLVGSGVTSESVGSFLPWADGFIVGTSLKEAAPSGTPLWRRAIRVDHVRALRQALDLARQS